ncbi:MAG: hypothetical protein ABW104_16160 [Candidatus Thiodiazotropha sp. 6PLUC2]
MKIDVHVHTKKTKQGDAASREVDANRFHQIIASTEVKIVAITNHNVFDLDQYEEFTHTVGGDFQIWPGVELDVVVEDRRGHLLVIVSPSKAKDLAKVICEVTKDTTPDAFTISISDVVLTFDQLNPIYIAHYKQKKPDLLDEDIEFIINNTAKNNRVLKEATNAVSAGIFICHGHASIYGSDVQNWDKYQAYPEKLPDLRLPVESFEQFCLLLDKDKVAINTLLDQKYPEKICVKPFKDDLPIELVVYDDINIFFGAKGTGKSDILAAIASFYSNKGIGCKKFEAGTVRLEDEYDLGGKSLKIDLKDFGIEYCNKEIELVRNASEVGVTSLSKYRSFFSDSLKNKKARTIKIKDFSTVSTQQFDRRLKVVLGTDDNVVQFLNFIEESDEFKKSITEDELRTLRVILNKASQKLGVEAFDLFSSGKSGSLFNQLVDIFKSEITKKTGTPSKPNGTGLREYARNRIAIELATQMIIHNIEQPIKVDPTYIGNLDDKGDLYCTTEILIQDGKISASRYKPLSKVKKNPQKDFAKAIKLISEKVYSEDLFNSISELNEIEGIDTIPTLLELLVFDRFFMIDEEEYKPSTGEASMILLHRELNEDKEIYILDEPEKSLGNEYINNVIVPLIKEKAKIGKKVFIATHDANIAVRTLPYNSVYRHHDLNGYKTYVGNPFSNNLTDLREEKSEMDWKEVSMRTLEGGRDAFGERGQIYGNP